MYGLVDGGVANALGTFLILLVVVGIVAGLALGGTEVFNRSIREAEADRIRAETEALRDRNAHEAREREIELWLAEEEAKAEIKALQERQAMLTALMQAGIIATLILGFIAGLATTVTISYYFFARIRAATAGLAPAAYPAATQAAVPPISRQAQATGFRSRRSASPFEWTKVRADQITYEGFLAHFYDCILHPNRPRVYYPTAIAPEIEDLYLAILTEVQAILWQTAGHSGWILPREIKRVGDIRQRISRHTFNSLVRLD